MILRLVYKADASACMMFQQFAYLSEMECSSRWTIVGWKHFEEQV